MNKTFIIICTMIFLIICTTSAGCISSNQTTPSEEELVITTVVEHPIITAKTEAVTHTILHAFSVGIVERSYVDNIDKISLLFTYEENGIPNAGIIDFSKVQIGDANAVTLTYKNDVIVLTDIVITKEKYYSLFE